MRLPHNVPDISAGILVVATHDIHVAIGSERLQHRGDRQSSGEPHDLLAVPDRRVPEHVLGAARRLRVLHQGVRQHNRVLFWDILVFQRCVDPAVRVRRSDQSGHDVHPRLLQHMVRSASRVVRVHEAADGGQQDQLAARGLARPAQPAGRRVRDLLPRDALGEDHALQPLLPRRVPAEVAVRAGPLSAVPRHPVQDRQRRQQGQRLGDRQRGEQQQPEPAAGGGPRAAAGTGRQVTRAARTHTPLRLNSTRFDTDLFEWYFFNLYSKLLFFFYIL